MIEKMVVADTMEVDNLGTTERGRMGFGSSDLNPKRIITAEEERVNNCFLQANTTDNAFFSTSDIAYHPQLMKEREMLSSTDFNAALT